MNHKNFEESGNRPENLEFMGAREHSTYHRLLVERNQYFQSPEFELHRLNAIAQKAQTPEGHKYYAERGTLNILRYMQEQPEHFKQAVASNGKRGKQYLIAYNQSEKGRAKTKEIANRYYTYDFCGAEIKSSIGLHNHKKNEHKCNHKVSQVVALDYQEDVYCLTVPEHNNFALKVGVFVHNCGMSAIKTPLIAEQLEGKLKQIRRSAVKKRFSNK